MYGKIQNGRMTDGILLAGIILVVAGLGMNFTEKNGNTEVKIIRAKKENKTEIKELQKQSDVLDPVNELDVKGVEIININAAGAGELDKLNGVGPKIAEKIIDYRVKNGGFKNINEIKLVSGIGDKLFEKIKDQIGI